MEVYTIARRIKFVEDTHPYRGGKSTVDYPKNFWPGGSECESSAGQIWGLGANPVGH